MTAAEAAPDEETTPTYGYRVRTDAAASPGEPPADPVVSSPADEPTSVNAFAPDAALETVSAPPDVWHYVEAVAPADDAPHTDAAPDDWSTPSWLDDAVSAATAEAHPDEAPAEASEAASTNEASAGTPPAAEAEDAITEAPPPAPVDEPAPDIETHLETLTFETAPVASDAEPKPKRVRWSPFGRSAPPSQRDETPVPPPATDDAHAAPTEQSTTVGEHAAEPDVDHEPIAATSEDEHEVTAAGGEEDELGSDASGPAVSEFDAAEPGAAHADEETLPARKPGSILRTPGPWSWPLAEHDEQPAAGAGGAHRDLSDDPDETDDADEADEAMTLEPATVGATRHEDAATAEHNGEQGFFNRDEPVGSQYVDFDEVRTELVQIGVVWLGDANSVQVTRLLLRTRSTIDDFVATIDTIRGLHIDGQDPASIQAMAREMHQQAAERLCGA